MICFFFFWHHRIDNKYRTRIITVLYVRAAHGSLSTYACQILKNDRPNNIQNIPTYAARTGERTWAKWARESVCNTYAIDTP